MQEQQQNNQQDPNQLDPMVRKVLIVLAFVVIGLVIFGVIHVINPQMDVSVLSVLGFLLVIIVLNILD